MFRLHLAGKSRKLFHVSSTIISGLLLLTGIGAQLSAQRTMEYITRGLVAVNSADNVFLSWRIFASDADSVQFNLYRNDTLVNATPISGKSNYSDSDGRTGSIYYLETLYSSGRTELSTPVDVWAQQYKTIVLQRPGDAYYPNDASIGDLDGDGEMEIIVKLQTSNPDNTGGDLCDPVFLHAYKMNGTLLWSIDLGVNIRAGSHYTQLMVYDLDSDGIAEVACKTAPGTKDGEGNYLSEGPAASDNDAADYRNSSGMILTGPEYLTVFDGQTGAEITTVEYVPVRGNVSDWGDSYGNRVDRFLACVAYFSDEPSLVMCRGYYTRTVLAAWDFDGANLSQRWVFDTDNGYSSYEGQGNHNLSVADVDQDGKDEIIYGSMCVDDDGKGLWNTGLGHGDAMHVSDIDPDRPGLEKWGITEPEGTSGSQLLDAKTGAIIWQTPAGDIPRGVAGDITADFYGMECWGGTDQLRSCKDEHAGGWPSSSNFVIWWDGDLVRELLDGVTVSKYNGSGDIDLYTASGCMSNNGTKSTPTISGDIFGGWREEVVFKTMDDKELRIFTTTTPTEYGLYTLLQDPQYRLALVWQNVGYNQPPHPGFYLGDGMNINALPQPNINVRDAEHPSLVITAPSDGIELGLGLDLNLVVHPTGLSGTDSRIIISSNGIDLDTIKSAPYYTTISGLTTGSYTFTASGFDLNGDPLQSNTIHITVDEGDPHVSLISPVAGNAYLPEDSILLEASAYDTDGTIDSVELYLDGSKLMTFTGAPYSLKIANPGVGIHEVKAIAYDNDGKSTESEIVSVEIGLMNTIQETETGFCGFVNGDGWIESNNVGFTGSGFANTDNISGVGISWVIDFPETGTYKFIFRYAASSERPGRLYLNGTASGDIPFGNTVDWTTWETIALNATAQAGINNVILEATGGSGLPNIDYIKIYSLEADQAVTGVSCDELIPSNTATLESLSVAESVLDPAFSSAVFSYDIGLDMGTEAITIIAVPTDPNSSVTGDSIVAIGTTPGSVDVVVTSRDGTTSNSYTINYSFLISTGELSRKEPEIFPVPASDLLLVRMDDSAGIIHNASIWTIDGKLVMQTNNLNTIDARIDVSGLEDGIYLIQVDTDNNSYTKKIVINKK